MKTTRILLVVLALALVGAACGDRVDTTVAGAPTDTNPDQSPATEPAEPSSPATPALADERGVAVVAEPSTGAQVAAGILDVHGDCVMLDERGHAILLLAWPAAMVETTAAGARPLSIRADDGQVVDLSHLDRITVTGERLDDAAELEWITPPGEDCEADGVFHLADVTEWLTPGDRPPGGSGPIGGGLASGSGSPAELLCPDGTVTDTTEWFGPATLTLRGAVAEAFGDLVIGWMGEPYELETTETWSSWGLDDDTGNLVAVATMAAGNGGWDPSHARFCVIPEPQPPAPAFTLYVSNQSFDEPTVHITISVDDVVIVDQSFEVGDQHNWITFEPEVDPGAHTLRAESDTGAVFSVEFVLPQGEPRWAVVDYWTPGSGSAEPFTFHISPEPIGFA